VDISRRTVLVVGVGTVASSIAAFNLLADHSKSVSPGAKPVSYPDLAAARKGLRTPADANYVMWDHGRATLEEVFMTLGDNDVLVLPERDDPYVVDSSDGFRAAGVSAVRGAGDSRIPIVSTYKDEPARTWFAMARARRGILGLGPNAVIALSDSGWKGEPQIPDAEGSDPGRLWFDTAGIQQGELVGCQEKVIEVEHPDGYFGNFTMTGRDLGGIAYHALTMQSGIHERIHHAASWRGFSATPNGEAGAVSVLGGQYLIADSTLDPVDHITGKRVGSSPIMVNSSPGGRVKNVTADMAAVGMPTWWNCSGVHEAVNLYARWGNGPGVNLEHCADGFEFAMTGGALWPNRDGEGGHPAPDGIAGNGMHISLDALGTAKIILVDVDLDASIRRGLNVQGYGATDANGSQVTISAKLNGKRVQSHLYL
jgi:hypothetical protein